MLRSLSANTSGTVSPPAGRPAVWENGNKTAAMIRKLASGRYRLYSRKKNRKTDRRRNPGTFRNRAAAEKHECAVQYFKRHRGAAPAPWPGS